MIECYFLFVFIEIFKYQKYQLVFVIRFGWKINSYSQKGRSVWFHSHLPFCTCTSNCLTIVWRYWWVHQLVYILYACPLVIIEPDRVYEPWSIIRVLKYKPAYIIKHSNPRRRSLSLQKETTATNVRTYW